MLVIALIIILSNRNVFQLGRRLWCFVEEFGKHFTIPLLFAPNPLFQFQFGKVYIWLLLQFHHNPILPFLITHIFVCWFEKCSCLQTTHEVNTPGPLPHTLFLLPSFDINCLMLKHGSDYHQGLLVQFVRNKCCKKKIIIKGCSINRGWLLFSWLFLARWLAALVDHPPSTPVMMSAW